jgi:hypothetical protein
MFLHDHVNKLIDGNYSTSVRSPRRRDLDVHTIFVTNEHFAIQYLVVAENVVQHLFVEAVFRGRCESDFHTTGLLVLQVDVSVPNLACCGVYRTSGLLTGAAC